MFLINQNLGIHKLNHRIGCISNIFTLAWVKFQNTLVRILFTIPFPFFHIGTDPIEGIKGIRHQFIICIEYSKADFHSSKYLLVSRR